MSSQTFLQQLMRMLGIEASAATHSEKWISGAGGLFGILAIVYISKQFVPVGDVAWIVASMGASAVLLFAVPHGPLAQPWPVFAGHLVSAIVGVSCAQLVSDVLLAAGLAVAIAIVAMYYLRCIHPPGGATALTAVVGGSSLHQLGFQYVLTPVLLNALVILLIAVAFNYPFAWRRYPAALAHRTSRQTSQITDDEGVLDSLTRSDLDYALQQLNRTIDINPEDLEAIYSLAEQHVRSAHLHIEDIVPGHYYSNGHFGEKWQVRQIIDAEQPIATPDDLVIYKVAAGHDRWTTGTSTISAFAHWARYEVYLNENSWQRRDNSIAEM